MPIYVVPELLASLLLNVGMFVVAMGLARERETGTLAQIMVTPISPAVLLTDKCLPFIVFGLIDVCAIVLLGLLLFGVSIRGSPAVVVSARSSACSEGSHWQPAARHRC